MRSRVVWIVVRGARFAIVGVVATLCYLAVASFGALVIGFTPMVNNVVAWAASIGVSYLGHNHFTFQAGGQHEHYLPRYLIATAILFGASVLVTYLGEHVFEMSAFSIGVMVSVAYPVMSVLINVGWTFARAMRQERSVAGTSSPQPSSASDERAKGV